MISTTAIALYGLSNQTNKENSKQHHARSQNAAVNGKYDEFIDEAIGVFKVASIVVQQKTERDGY